MRYQLVIFDFDGTLADSFPWVVRNLDQAAERHGFKRVPPDEIDGLRGLSARQVIAHLEVPAWKLPTIMVDMHHRMAAEIDQIQLFAGIEEALEALAARGIQLALLTSNSEANVRRVLGERTAARVAAYACGTALFGKGAKLRKLVARFKVPPEQVLCVGDEIRDAEAAHKEGLPFGAVAWGYTRLEALVAQRPAETFLAPADLMALAGHQDM